MFYRNVFDLEACLMMSSLKWDMTQPSKMFVSRKIVAVSDLEILD